MNLSFDSYNNELKKRRLYLNELKRCKERREELHSIYLGGANPFKEQVKGGKSINPMQDAQARYHDATNCETYINLDGIDYSINEYIEKLKEILEKQKVYLEGQSEILDMLEGRDYELYYMIKVKGYKPTRAVTEMAIKYDITESNIWRREYRRIKKYLKNNNSVD